MQLRPYFCSKISRKSYHLSKSGCLQNESSRSERVGVKAYVCKKILYGSCIDRDFMGHNNHAGKRQRNDIRPIGNSH